MVDGKLDKAAAVKFVTEQLKGDDETTKVSLRRQVEQHAIIKPQMFQVATAAIDFCEKDSVSKKPDFEAMMKSAAAGEKVCNMISAYMIGCIHAQVFKNCPKDKYTADAQCDAIKAFADKCNCLSPLMMKA